MRLTRLRPRLTLRVLMVLVALSGIASGVEVLRRRSREFDARSQHYARLKDEPGFLLCGNAYLNMDTKRRERYDEEVRLRAAYFETMAKKYARAARNPWLLDEPDPKAPDALTEVMGKITSADDW